jgi:hypothetical protein
LEDALGSQIFNPIIFSDTGLLVENWKRLYHIEVTSIQKIGERKSLEYAKKIDTVINPHLVDDMVAYWNKMLEKELMEIK